MRNCLLFLVAVAAFFCASCATAEKEYVEADESTLNSVGVEWLDMGENAYRQNPDGSYEPWVTDIVDDSGNVVETREDRLDRRQRKFDTWKLRIDAARDKKEEAPATGAGDGQ